MAIKKDSTLWLWGDNSEGQLGDGSPPAYRVFPDQLGTATDWQSISAGDYYSLALKQNGLLWTWGDNTFGKLGDGTNIDNNIATYIPNCWATSVDNMTESTSDFIVYPNPAKTKVYFNVDVGKYSSPSNQALYNSVGQLLFTSDKNEMDISKYNSGIYYIKVGNHFRRLIID